MINCAVAPRRLFGIRQVVGVLLLGLIPVCPRAGTTTYTYDVHGRLSSVVTAPAGANASTSIITYDNGDNRTSVVENTPPNTPTGLTANPEAYNWIQLNWTTPTLDANGANVASYKLYRNGSFLVSTTGPPYNDEGLAPNTPYTYTLSAVDQHGSEGTQSGPASATTPPGPDTIPPSVPTNLQGTAVSGTQIDLTWGASTDTGGSGLAGYQVFRNGGSSPIATSTVASYNDQGLTPATTYTYTVLAYDNAGNKSAMSNQVSVATPDTIPPSAPGNPTFSSITSTSATASWTAATDNVGITNYRYSLNGGSSWTSAGNVLSVNLTGLFVNTAYTMLVEAGDSAGNWGPAGSGSFSTTAGYYTDNMTLSIGDSYQMNGNILVALELGYIQGSLGTLTPTTTTNGFTVSCVLQYANYSTGQTEFLFEVSGFTTNPGAGWLQSINVPNIGTLNATAASFSYSSGTAEWEWTPMSTAPGNGTLTVVHQ